MALTKQVSIFIAEDHLISRTGLKMLLQQTSTFDVVGEAEDGEAAVQQIKELKPDLVIMDLEMPKLGGVEATAILKDQMPEVKVLIFTSAGDDASIFSALKAGANGYCLKTISAEMLAMAIQSVMNGAAWLDPTIAQRVLHAQANSQVEDKPNLSTSKIKLLALIEQGKNVDEIASEMDVHDSLVKGLLNELLVQLKGDKENLTDTKTLQPHASIAVGSIIGEHYHIDELIGQGGMGCVYKAKHTHIGRIVAIKTLHENVGLEGCERFKTEARASAALIHPNLVTIFDFGLVDDKIPYLVMEYLKGKSLGTMLANGEELSMDKYLSVFAQVCDGLQAIHKSGIVHRDLKPSNLMLIPNDGGTYTAKLVDLGIAKILWDPNLQLTCTGEAIGTPLYMSPEQCKSKSVDHRSDLYSLGCTMYAAFTGQPPFVGPTVLETYQMQVAMKPNAKPLEAAGVSDNVINLVLSLLEKLPENRPESAQKVKEALLKG